MEYSPMMLLMLWALTPSSEAVGAVPATVEELPPPGMTVHQESYFTFNHGKPFLAEKDPVTGAILNLRTTPVTQDDYLYEEEEEASDGIDRKDGPKLFTRNDIATPSKDPDLHKFLNLPVHYSSSGKFPLISSSYANMKVQGHNAASYPNHRPASTTSTSTVSPSYYPLKTSATTSATSSTTTTTTTTSTKATSTTTTTTSRPPTARTTTTTKSPPPAYEYEYEYDYDRDQDSTDKKSTTQTILDFFEKDYAFLGNSEEEKNNTKVEYVLPSATENKKKDETVMVSSNTNIFIPPDYLKPSTKENKTEYVLPENKTTVFATTQETIAASPSTPSKTVIVEATEAGKPMSSSINQKVKLEFGMRTTMKPTIETTTPKIVETTKPTYKEQKVPFFPTIPTTDNTIVKRPVEESITKESNPPKQTTATPQEARPTENTVAPVKPLQFHHPYLKPQDIYALQNRPNEQLRPYNPYQATINANVPPEMQPPKKPTEPTYYPRPGSDSFTYRPADPVHFSQNRPLNTRPTEPIPNTPLVQQQEHHRPQYELRPSDLQQLMSGHVPQKQNRPTEVKPHDGKPLDVPITRPNAPSIPSGQTGPMNIPHTRPFEGAPQKPENQNLHPPRPMNNRPSDTRYPPMYGSTHHQEFRPDQRPMPEYRPLPPRPEEMRPTSPQEVNVALGTRVPEYNKRPEVPQLNNNNYQVQFTQPSKVENHFIKVSPGQENPSYSLQTSFSIGVPPPAEVQGQGSITSSAIAPTVNQGLSKPGQGIGQVLFPDEDEKKPQPASRPWGFEDKRQSPPAAEQDKYPRPPWETHIKPPLVFNHMKKEPYPFKRPKPTRPDLPNILPQFRPNAKIGHADPHAYHKTPYDTLRPPPLPRPQFLRAEQPLGDEEKPVHRRNGQTTHINPLPIQPIIQPQTSKRATLRSEDEKTDPVFVVYPSNNAQDGVVVGTRGAQRPLPPDNLDIEDSFPLDSNKNFQSRVDTPILKGKPTTKPAIKNDFPYPIVKPAEVTEEKSVSPIEKVTKEYTAFSPTVSPAEKEHDTEINVIPYLQDYMPFATKKPIYDPPKWNVGDDIKPISVTLKTHKIEETTIKTENHKTGDHPTPQDFQAPFHASLSAPSQGWSVVRPRPEPEKEDETTTVKVVEESEGKFDIQNFKPQLFGGFQPIIPPVSEIEEKKPVKNEKEAR